MKWLAGWLLALSLLLTGQAGMAASIQVDSLKILTQDSRYLLDARLTYQLSPAMIEALDSGVAMSFRLQLKILPEHPGIWQRPVYKRRLTYRLSYHALAAVYELLSPDQDQVQRFTTREAALRALGRLANIPLLDMAEVDAAQPYELQLKASLDIESLPVPLRPLAYLSNDWNLNLDLGRWPLAVTLDNKTP